ncbi:hypothetical protein BDD43_3762 [Mucilaginibacter gracilis]|uniref:DUF6377 domain-containing protein n=1 Tax=Mucilaginibacter gracilis TaxID=423350 RepID=A0A495J4N0_9SPHI|nr:DUF6377 domain-containing protein [Mucilaginibacter gracilis]RKR83552.1 hypothetical protein BDD43_3762 [Mucilaginibacter gracilis]
MRSYLLYLLLVIPFTAFSSSKTDSLFDRLKYEFSQKSVYDSQKENAILKLKKSLASVSKSNFEVQYNICLKLYDEYKSYQYDSAYVYAGKMLELSGGLKDKSKKDYSKIKIAFILISSGMFKETFENLKGVRVKDLDVDTKIEYYSLLTRAYYDVAAYDNDKIYSPVYRQLANKYIDSAIALSAPNSYDKIYLSGFKKLKNGLYKQASPFFLNLLNNYKLSTHQYAIVSSTLSEITPDNSERVALLARAAISDIKSSTKETVALLWLAQLLYKSSDTENVYQFLQQALNDAEFYGARQRKIQINTLLPIVASEKVNYIERENTRFLIFLSSITVLALLVISFAVTLFKQLKKVKIKEKIIDDKNVLLEKINERLVEGTKIKEDYIGYFFNVISGYILQLEKLKRSVDMKLHAKKYDDIQILIDRINIKKERDNLFYTFDHVFIKIFPNFVTAFNALFKEEDQIWPKEDEVLTTDLRIFALIRMGINDTETIAKILEYSEKTIYVYKMRIKAKALIQGDEFDHRIMAIKAVDASNTPNK